MSLGRREIGIAAILAGGVVLAGSACDDDPEKSAAVIASEDNAVVLCERLFSCCSPSELSQLPFVDEVLPPSFEGCVALHKRTALEYVGITNAAAGAQRVALHLDRNPECVKKIREEACPQFHARLRTLHLGDAYALCNSAVVEPLVADNAACTLYFDCKSGNCEGAPGDGGTGTCKALPKDGQTCAVDGCAENLRCNPATNKCTPLLGPAGACTSDDACESGACRDGKCVSPGRCGG